MTLPEWGNSYNALSVPLPGHWQCSLVPARDADEPTSWWSLPFDERQKKRKDRKEQIEQDRRDFDRLFRVDIDRRAARTSNEFSAYLTFLRDHLSITGMSAPVDGEGLTRILRKAVRDGQIIPAISRAWNGSRQVSRSYAPQNWPKRMPDAKPTIYGVRDGQFIPLDSSGYFVDFTPCVFAAVAAAGALLGGDSVLGDVGDDSTLLGDAQPFDYQPDAISDSTEELAASTNNPDYAATMLGYNRKTFGDMVHAMKDDLDLRGDDNVIWHDTGDIEFRKDIIGNMHDYAF
jgi:hypothetical protein